ncbi:hypothetical protein CC86DRAFT_371369 [Ophiobolus disseminans]|uniref:DUF1772-domain-containing protein n=1 Tax=Ophiobolus disseminans TaxID=1469910 RepID=A0A6A6ZUY0_9PLEO|nr:hypothetical protein CC86DRAFT_371369 [Ophiobolus disseminans]
MSIPVAKSFLQLACTSALSGYALFLSYQNITRLQQYEEKSKKAAEWSNTAAQRLHKTRATQTSGTISLLISFFTPIALLSSSHGTNPTILMTAGAANAVILFFARTHMANFWNDSVQTRVPFVQKFNDAIRGSEQVVRILGALSAAWGVATVGWAAMGWGWI